VRVPLMESIFTVYWARLVRTVTVP
jgi:hypothetical protein